jgi:hypothetical protein
MSEKERFLDRQSAIDFIVNSPLPEYDDLKKKADECWDEHLKWFSVVIRTSAQIALLEKQVKKLEIEKRAAKKIADGSGEFARYNCTLANELYKRFQSDGRFTEWLTKEAIADAFRRRNWGRIHAKTESIDLDSESSDA